MMYRELTHEPLHLTGGIDERSLASLSVWAVPGLRFRGTRSSSPSRRVPRTGRPYIHHVRRVAAAVPPEVASVAWLHDTLEWTDVSEEDLAAAGLAPQEVAALRLLTRPDESDDESFLSHVRVIALTPGPAGDIARAVKRTDMEDRLRLPRDPGAAWRPPYRRALGVLARYGAGWEPGWAPPDRGGSAFDSRAASSDEGGS